MKQTIQSALTRKGYETLTPVQEAVSAPELEGRDLLVSAQTGSGKTIGFGLAIAPTILAEGDTFGQAAAPLALVIAPTRELAMQVKRELGWLYEDAGAFIASCVGGMDMRDERRALARGAHLVVATPGRLRDHIMRGSIDLTAVRAVVLDEADEMLDLGFREDLEFILEETPTERQTLLFSATVPRAIASLATRYQNNAERVSTIGEQKQHADIEYRAMHVGPRDGENAIINVLRYYEAPNAIVFCNTRAMVSRLTTRLSNRGFSVVALSGELTQSERSNALQAMRDGRARVCVATDVAARGIDLPNLDLVIHAELPSSHETLLHRSGRTGRAGRKGVSALVVVPQSRKKAERILKFAKLTAEWGAAPSADEVNARDLKRMVKSDDWTVEVTEGEQASVDELLATYSHAQIAAAYVRQYKRLHTPPEELTEVSGGARPEREDRRAAFGPSVWFTFAEGRNANASPRYLLPMICKAGGITKDDIGAIRVGDDLSYVEIRESSVADFVAAIGDGMQIEGKAIVQLDGVPDLPKAPPRGPKPGGRGPNRGPGGKPQGKPYKKHGDAPRPYKAPGGERSGDAPKSYDKAPRKEGGFGKDKSYGKSKDPAKGGGFGKDTDRTKGGAKPHRKGAAPGKGGDFSKGPRKERGEAGHKPGGKPNTSHRKGPPPPKGKPNSKKNKARASQVRGGEAAPKRRGDS